MFDSVLVVCTGNICRSPIAERILISHLPELNVSSAGIEALKGKDADVSAIAVAEKHGLSLCGHKGKQFNFTQMQKYDLILVMERLHIEYITKNHPECRGKTMLLGHWMDKREIPDPYMKGPEAFEFVFRLIDQACQYWVDKLST
ncbi:protein tyrosine phosphatase [Rahnella sp. AA]|uniref:arsenate reductase/protein-tyrosine-phosphatase family protein n=1 Tax=Rahnella sp. AA TaxID=2057180 RepID=UPI000C339E24|nr:protein tyrosine phosphatase [Rahnella sp. AA]PKE32804.1 protein tyrosine phosphatase [Rahnella sp. AA]